MENVVGRRDVHDKKRKKRKIERERKRGSVLLFFYFIFLSDFTLLLAFLLQKNYAGTSKRVSRVLIIPTGQTLSGSRTETPLRCQIICIFLRFRLVLLFIFLAHVSIYLPTSYQKPTNTHTQKSQTKNKNKKRNVRGKNFKNRHCEYIQYTPFIYKITLLLKFLIPTAHVIII